MAVVFVTTLTVKPDRFEEYLEENARKAKALVEKHGGRNSRLLAALVGMSLVFLAPPLLVLFAQGPARLLRLAAADCPKSFAEFIAANAELKKLGTTR